MVIDGTGDDGVGGGDITVLLRASAGGDDGALSALWERVYREVHDLASRRLVRESDAVNLQATMLVHETFRRVHGGGVRADEDGSAGFENRRHFFGSVSRAMERVLIDHARSRGRLKRGGGARRVELSIAEGELADFDRASEAGGTVEALELLERLSREEGMGRCAEVVRLRFVLGLTVPQTADVLGVSERTVKSDWAFARAWLGERLSAGLSDGAAGSSDGGAGVDG